MANFKNSKTLFFGLLTIILSFPVITLAKVGLFMPDCVNSGKCSICDILAVVVNFIQWIWGISAAIALVLFVVNGIGIITSAGSSDKLTKAKNGMVNTIIALLVIFGSWTIINTLLVILLPNNTPGTTAKILGRDWSNYCAK